MRKILLFFIIINSTIFANIITGGVYTKRVLQIDNINLITKADKLNQVTQTMLISATKIENIQTLIKLALKENRVNFIEQFKYIKIFKNIKNGDKLLLRCLKYPSCNLEEYSSLMNKSPMHIKIASKYPNMSLVEINHRIGGISENIMNKYFKSMGWSKIEGEIGRNGIDGIFIKRKAGLIIDIMVVESKYNKSTLGNTNHGRQMSKQWLSKKIDTLEKKYPNNKEYKTINRYIESNNYKAILWNLKVNNNNLVISVKKINDNNGKILTSNIKKKKR